MARYEYLILSCAQPGREAEFEKWYDEQHIVDVLAVPGVVSARRFHVESQEAVDVDVPTWAWFAMAGGVTISILVGGGLMALIFYSSRKGYDEPPKIEPDDRA